MAYLIDTNVLLRWMRLADPDHETAQQAIGRLTAQGERLYVAPQSIVEFWYVATRAVARNGYGLTVVEVEPQIARIERTCLMADDAPAIYSE